MDFVVAYKNKRVRYDGLVHYAKKVHVSNADRRTCAALLRCGDGVWTRPVAMVTRAAITRLACLA